MGLESETLEKQGFETFAKTGDIYQLFYELGVNLLRNNGQLCFIQAINGCVLISGKYSITLITANQGCSDTMTKSDFIMT